MKKPVSSSDSEGPPPKAATESDFTDNSPDTDLDSDPPPNTGSHLKLDSSPDTFGTQSPPAKLKKLKFNKSDGKEKKVIQEKKKALMNEGVVTLGDIDSVLSGGDISVKDGSARRGKVPKGMLNSNSTNISNNTAPDDNKSDDVNPKKPNKSSKKGIAFEDSSDEDDSVGKKSNGDNGSAQKSILTFFGKKNNSSEPEVNDENVPAPAPQPASTPKEPEEPSLPFRCKICDDAFKMPRLLRKHEVGAHPGQPVTPVAELERQMKKWCNGRKRN